LKISRRRRENEVNEKEIRGTEEDEYVERKERQKHNLQTRSLVAQDRTVPALI
jgi:hypothetical protein